MVYSLLTTVDRVRRRGAIMTQEDDQLLEELIAEVSADAEDFLGRHIVSTARTEIYRLQAHVHSISLAGYPVASISSVKLHSRTDDWADVTELDSSRYVLDEEAGTIFIRTTVEHDPTFAQVVYTGGLVSASGDDAEAITKNFIASFPHIAAAVDQEVIERNRRRKMAGAGQIASKGAMTQNPRQSGLLDDTRRRLRYLKPVRVS